MTVAIVYIVTLIMILTGYV